MNHSNGVGRRTKITQWARNAGGRRNRKDLSLSLGVIRREIDAANTKGWKKTRLFVELFSAINLFFVLNVRVIYIHARFFFCLNCIYIFYTIHTTSVHYVQGGNNTISQIKTLYTKIQKIGTSDSYVASWITITFTVHSGTFLVETSIEGLKLWVFFPFSSEVLVAGTHTGSVHGGYKISFSTTSTCHCFAEAMKMTLEILTICAMQKAKQLSADIDEIYSRSWNGIST